MRLSRRTKVTVVYKSGAVVKVRCDSFKIQHSGGQLTSASWENATPRPMLFGVDEVAAIWSSKQ